MRRLGDWNEPVVLKEDGVSGRYCPLALRDHSSFADPPGS